MNKLAKFSVLGLWCCVIGGGWFGSIATAQTADAVKQRQEYVQKSRDQLNAIRLALAKNLSNEFVKKAYPAGYSDQDGKLLLSWRVAILPALGEEALWKQFRLDEPWDSEHNRKLIPTMPAVFKPVRGESKEGHTYYRGFAGDEAMFPLKSSVVEKVVVGDRSFFPVFCRPFVKTPDGTSNTFLMAEAGETVPWTKPDELVYDPKQPLPKLGGQFDGDFIAMSGDGTTRLMTRTIPEPALRAAITAARGENIQLKPAESGFTVEFVTPEMEERKYALGNQAAKSPHASLAQITDATNQTAFAGIVAEGRAVPWTKPDDLVFDETFQAKDNTDNAFVPGAFLFADGSARYLHIQEGLDRAQFRALFTIAGKEPSPLTSLYPPGHNLVQPTYATTQEHVRHAEARTKNLKSLKEIALAFHNYQQVYRHLPPAVVYGPDGKPWHSWRVLILPFLEQGGAQLYQQYDGTVPWDHPKNAAVLAAMPLVYRDPLAEKLSNKTRYLLATGVGTAFPTKPTANVAATQPTVTRPATTQPTATQPAATQPSAITFSGHTSFANCVAFSPDGKRLATASADQTAKVWDAASGKELLTMKGHSGEVTCVAFSPNGKWLATASHDQTVKVWDAANGQESLTLKGHTGVITSVAFSADGKRLASASYDKTVILWDATTGRLTRTFNGHTLAVMGVAFSSDGKWLASAGSDFSVRVWEAANGQAKHALSGHSKSVTCVAYSPDGKTLATGSQDQTVRLWDADNGKEKLTLTGHSGGVFSVAFHPDGKRLLSVSGGREASVKEWDTTSGQQTGALTGPATVVRSVAISPDGKRFATATGHVRHLGDVKVWDVAVLTAKPQFSQPMRQLPPGSDMSRPEFLTPERRQLNLLVGGTFEGDAASKWKLNSFRANKESGAIEGGVVKVVKEGQKAAVLHTTINDDTHFDQTVAVKPGMRYLLSGWIKTKDVEIDKDDRKYGKAGATLSVWGGYEHSRSLVGTNDWTYSTLIFDSGNRTEVTVLARLGYWYSTASGEAWFDDLCLIPIGESPVKPSAQSPPPAPGPAEKDNLLVNGSFEEGPDFPENFGYLPNVRMGSTAIKGWTVTRGNIDVAGIRHWVPGHGQRSIDLHGTPGFGGIKQTFKTVVGQRYQVSFLMAGTPLRKQPIHKLAVRAADKQQEFSFDATGRTQFAVGWERKSWEFTAVASETTLEIHTLETEDSNSGPILDDVSVIAVGVNAPSQPLKSVQAEVPTTKMSGKTLRRVEGNQDDPLTVSLRGHEHAVLSLAVSPDGKSLASGDLYGSVLVWNVADRKLRFELTGTAGQNITGLAFSPDGKLIATGNGKSVKLWDAANGQELKTFSGHTDQIWSVAFSPDSKRLASGSHDKSVKVWDIANGEAITTLTGKDGAFLSMAFSSDGKWLAGSTSYGDSSVVLWDTRDWKESQRLSPINGQVRSIAFSPNSQRLMTASDDGTVQVWDSQTGEDLLTLRDRRQPKSQKPEESHAHHHVQMKSVALSFDGKRLVSAGSNGFVTVWDAVSGQKLHSLEGHTGEVRGVVFSPDGKWVASAGSDKTVKVWTLTGRTPLPADGTILTTLVDPKKAEADLKTLEGTWQITDYVTSSKQPESAERIAAIKEQRWIFRGDVLTVIVNGEADESVITIDPTRPLKAIDLASFSRGDGSPSMLGLYSIAGDTLKLALSPIEAGRPKAMQLGEGVLGVMTLTRTKPFDMKLVDSFNLPAWRQASKKLQRLKVKSTLLWRGSLRVGQLDRDFGLPKTISRWGVIELPTSASTTASDDSIPAPIWSEIASISHVAVLAPAVSDTLLKQLAQHPGLIALNCRGAWSATESSTAELKKSPHLVSIGLEGSSETTAILHKLTVLCKLRDLSINNATASNELLAAITQFKDLESLSLINTAVIDDHAAQLAKLTKLKMLVLQQTPVAGNDKLKLTGKGLQSLKSLKELKYLDLQGHGLTPEAEADFKVSLPECVILR